jgi:hypothetical protein
VPFAFPGVSISPSAKVALNAVPVLPFRTWGLVPSGPLLFAVACLRGDKLPVPREEIVPLLIAAVSTSRFGNY